MYVAIPHRLHRLMTKFADINEHFKVGLAQHKHKFQLISSVAFGYGLNGLTKKFERVSKINPRLRFWL